MDTNDQFNKVGLPVGPRLGVAVSGNDRFSCFPHWDTPCFSWARGASEQVEGLYKVNNLFLSTKNSTRPRQGEALHLHWLDSFPLDINSFFWAPGCLIFGCHQAAQGTREEAVDDPSKNNVDGQDKDIKQIGIDTKQVVAHHVGKFGDAKVI